VNFNGRIDFFNRGNAVAHNMDLGEKKQYVIVKKTEGFEYILYDKNSF